MTCGLQSPSLKNTVEKQSAVVRWQVQGTSPDTRPDKMLMGSCEKMFFFARAPKSLNGFAKFQRQITKFGLPENL